MQNLTKTIAALILSIALLCAAGCKKHNSGNGSYNGHDYIDLGLPSGTMWATCNVGAENPEGYGDYFAWGETQPKAVYTDSNYVYSHGGYDDFTKYCTKPEFGYNGFTDNLKTLQPSDDAATVNWGEGWRTPTMNEWIELVTKCSYNYWSSSLNTGMPIYAKGFQFIIDFDDCDIYDDFSRCAGYSVRPVRASR